MQDNSIKTGACHQPATVNTIPSATSREAQTDEFREILRSASPRLQSIIRALLILLNGKTLEGKPLTDTERAEGLALVLPNMEKLRADGSPDVENLMSEILLCDPAKGGKRL